MKELHTLIPKVDSLRWETHIENIELISSKVGVEAVLVAIDGGAVIEGSYEEPLVKLTDVDITKGITNKSVGISNKLHNLLSSNPSIVHVDKP